MPAWNAGGGTVAAGVPDYTTANPSAGAAVAMSPFSGPKGSPLDAKIYAPGTTVTKTSNTADHSTGGLNTGIGFGKDCRVPGMQLISPFFTDDYQPGITLPNGVASTTAILTTIGGGKCTITPGSGSDYSKGVSTVVPYVAQPLLGFGYGGSRDAGAGPAFTGFGSKLVTAVADVANGAVIETGWVNRSNVTLKTGLSQFGSAVAASPAVT